MLQRKKKLHPGQGVVQFLAQKAVVIELRMLGYPSSVIHRKLLDSKKITMSYEAFLYNVRRHIYNRGDDAERARTTEETRKKDVSQGKRTNLPAVSERSAAVATSEEKKTFGQDPPKEYTDVI